MTDMYIGTGGSADGDGQVWKWDGAAFSLFANFNGTGGLPALKRANVLVPGQGDGSLYAGVGSQHSAPSLGGGTGAARVVKWDASNVYSQVGATLTDHDIAYSMCWFNGELYVGLNAEDYSGSARVKKWDGAAWVDVFAPSVNGAPASYNYRYSYTLWVRDSKLHVGLAEGSVAGSTKVFVLESGTWVDLGGPSAAVLPLAYIEYDNKMVVAWGMDGSNDPIRFWNTATSSWDTLGTTPGEWAGATIFNCFAVFNGKLHVGVGGVLGELSVWRLEPLNNRWNKIAGHGMYGSWPTPIAGSGSEWVYRLQVFDGDLYACMANDSSNASIGVWKLAG